MKSCCFVVLFLVIVACILVADAAAGYRNRKRSSDDSADSIISNINDKDHLNLMDGDITTRELRDTDGDLVRKRATVEFGVRIWPGGVVPYKISSIFKDAEVKNIKAAMKNIEAKTCIKFRTQANSEQHYLDFKRGRGCSSPLGVARRRENKISLAEDCTKEVGVIEHEILHSLGFLHEQSRPDRDQYVKFNLYNIRMGNFLNFNIHSDADTQGLPYDFESLMHSGNKYFSYNGKQTLESIADPNKHLGNKGMTALDIKGINILYDCHIKEDKHDTNFDKDFGIWENYGKLQFKRYKTKPYADKQGPSKDHTTGSGYFAQIDDKPTVTRPRALLAAYIDSTLEGCRMNFYYYKGVKGSFYVVTQRDKQRYAYKQGSSTVWKQQIHSFVKGTVMVIFYGIPDSSGDIALAIDDVKFENCS